MAIVLNLPKGYKCQQGVTLVELIVALSIGVMLLGAIYSTFLGQQRIQISQNEVVETQQNIRAVIELMTRDIQMAGYDPTESGSAGITTADVGALVLTKDLTGDGIISGSSDFETVQFGFNGSDSNSDGIPNDVDGDGFSDGATFYRNNGDGNGFQPIADNIQAIEFIYLDENEEKTSSKAEIRYIQITILARAGQKDIEFTNSATYTTAGGQTWGPFGDGANPDHYRKRMLTAVVHCRNMGM